MSENAELKDLYRELVLDHARNPRNFGKLDHCSHSASGINPLCGDKLQVYLQVNDQDRITASSFEGAGCAISIASSSLLTEAIKDVDVATAESYVGIITQRLTSDAAPAMLADTRLEKLQALDGVRAYPSRVKCATLAWHALRAALSEQSSPATTE